MHKEPRASAARLALRDRSGQLVRLVRSARLGCVVSQVLPGLKEIREHLAQLGRKVFQVQRGRLGHLVLPARQV